MAHLAKIACLALCSVLMGLFAFSRPPKLPGLGKAFCPSSFKISACSEMTLQKTPLSVDLKLKIVVDRMIGMKCDRMFFSNQNRTHSAPFLHTKSFIVS